jgi:hypothetical protein
LLLLLLLLLMLLLLLLAQQPLRDSGKRVAERSMTKWWL